MLIEWAICGCTYMNVEVKNTNINMFSFFRLRVRIKALQQTIDTQSVRITDLISSQVLASMNGMENYTFFRCYKKFTAASYRICVTV